MSAGAGIASVVGVRSTQATQTTGGDELWHFNTYGTVTAAPTILGGTAFVGSWDANLYAIDAETGEEQWHFETGDSVRSSPTVMDGTVFVGSDDANLYAVDAETGNELWRFETGIQITSSPTVADGTVFIGSSDDNLYAVEAETGVEQWRFETNGYVSSSPTVVGGTVFVGSRDSNLYALDAETGEKQWHFETGYNDGSYYYVDSSPTVVDGTVFVGSTDYNLYAVDAETGAEQWRFETDDDVDSSPTVVDGTVFVGSDDETLYALDAVTGDEQWRFNTDGRVESSPTVAGQTVFVGSYYNKLYAIDAETGEERWTFETGDRIRSSPTVVDGTVFVGSHDGLYVVDGKIAGSSVGSRVLSGTLGHHSGWQGVGALRVETRDAIEIDHTAATLNGELAELDGGENVSTYFEWGEVGETVDNRTEEQGRDATGTFDATITDLDPGTEYRFRAVATVDGRAARAGSHSFTTDEGCFIATAACGTPDHEQVEELRSFRDRTLKGTRFGDLFIRTYYATSPPVASWIARSGHRRVLVRTTVVRPAATAVRSIRRIVSWF
ncbi:PQQ-binding-like beta-propeller repeat protein [Halovivax cerinus]|uniref:PQQ-binding-like beta-propeller repeat protein n=1 Tax=Halovivax cerinus TaxID=1487865 RepID=A0ABD5NJC5_9EURY|nr:PQQ-binding-like beta-propeller repeat protein [Halovivax cerinus]